MGRETYSQYAMSELHAHVDMYGPVLSNLTSLCIQKCNLKLADLSDIPLQI